MNIWKRYSMRVSKNWVKFNKMFTLSPWLGGEEIARLEIDLESGGRDEVMAGKLRLFLQDPPVGGTEQLVTLGDAYVIDIRVIGGDDPDFIYGGFVAFDEGGLVDCT